MQVQHALSESELRSNAQDFYQQHKTLIKQRKMNATYNDDCIFTPGVVVFKTDDDQYRLMSEAEWYSVDVITCGGTQFAGKSFKCDESGQRHESVRAFCCAVERAA